MRISALVVGIYRQVRWVCTDCIGIAQSGYKTVRTIGSCFARVENVLGWKMYSVYTITNMVY